MLGGEAPVAQADLEAWAIVRLKAVAVPSALAAA